LPVVSVGVAVAAIAFGIDQFVSIAMAPSLGVSHPDDVVVTSMGKAPLVGRENAVAVSTGREVIIWGGSNGSGEFFADGAAYDFVSGKWRRIATAPISGRSRAAAAWVDNRMIVWGGTGAHPGPHGLADGAAYDPTTDSWHAIREAPSAGRVDASAVAYHGKLYIVGGATPTGPQTSGQILEYDPVDNNWRKAASAGPAFAAAATSSGLVTVEVDPSSGRVTSHLITPSSIHASVEGIDSGSIGAEISAVTLVPAGQALRLVTTNRDGVTTVYTLRDSADGSAWSLAATMSDSEFRAVDDIGSTLRGSMKGYPSGAVLAVGSQGVWDLRKGGGRPVLGDRDILRHSVCGASSAYAVTQYGIVMWGGQTCRPDGPDVTGSGVLIGLSGRG
jgi:Galactose oxidase, central domain/Kelch motif